MIDAYFVLANDGRNALDLSCAHVMKEFSQEHHHLAEWVWWITFLGSGYALTTVAVLGVIWQLSRGNLREALIWSCIALTGDALNRGMKLSFGRLRPDASELREPILSARENLKSDDSFPSGHAMNSMIGYGLVAYFLAVQSRRPRHWQLLLTLMLLRHACCGH